MSCYKYYVYRYIRKDKNEVFYIGIGTKHSMKTHTHKQEYRRAYHIHNRNKYFKNVYLLTDIELEILYESNDYDEIISKEKEFIMLYGLKKDGGTLTNISNGGEGNSGVVKSEAEKLAMSNRMKAGGNHQSKKVINILTNIIYNSARDASLDYDYSYDSLLSKLSGKKRNNSNFIYLDKYEKGEIPDILESKTKKKIIDLDTNTIFDSIAEYSKYSGMRSSYIVSILKGKIKPKKKKINIDYYDGKK